MSKINVILGCFGLTIDNFVYCNSTENTILIVDVSLYNYSKIMDYLEVCRLFDKPLLDLNAIRHFIFNIHDRYDQVVKPIWPIKNYELYQKFIISHKDCGVFIKLDSDIKESIERKENTPIVGSLKLARGRR